MTSCQSDCRFLVAALYVLKNVQHFVRAGTKVLPQEIGTIDLFLSEVLSQKPWREWWLEYWTRTCPELFSVHYIPQWDRKASLRCYVFNVRRWSFLRYETPKRNAEAKTEKALNAALDVLAKWCDFKCRKKKWHFGPSHCLIRVLTETWSTKNVSHSSEWMNILTWGWPLIAYEHGKIIPVRHDRPCKRQNILKRQAGKWGCVRSTLNTTYKSYIRPILTCCG